MERAISQEEVTLRFGKMVIAHLITSVHGFQEFQDIAVEMLSQLLIETIKTLADRVRQVLALQKKTVPNSLHLLVVCDHLGLFSREQIYWHLLGSCQRLGCQEKSEKLRQYGRILFCSMEQANGYVPERNHSNIRYVPPAFTLRPAQAIPRRKEIYRFFKVVEPQDNACLLEAYAKLNPPAIEIIDQQEEDVVEVNHQRRHKISHNYTNLVGRGRQHQSQRQIVGKIAIELDPQTSSGLARNCIVIDAGE